MGPKFGSLGSPEALLWSVFRKFTCVVKKIALLVTILSVRRVSELAVLCSSPCLVLHKDKVIPYLCPPFCVGGVSCSPEDIVLPS